jgi:hypothetical protein
MAFLYPVARVLVLLALASLLAQPVLVLDSTLPLF